jgi:hypothetical protein
LTSQDIWDDLWGSQKKEEIPKKSSFNSVALAKYFQDKFIGAPWHSGFGMVNIQALAAQFAKWKSRTDSDTVKAMIDLYMTDASLRGKNPGWTDFLGHAEQINAKLNPVSVKDEWDLLEEELDRKRGISH